MGEMYTLGKTHVEGCTVDQVTRNYDLVYEHQDRRYRWELEKAFVNSCRLECLERIKRRKQEREIKCTAGVWVPQPRAKKEFRTNLNDWDDLDTMPATALAGMLTPLVIQRDKEAVIRIFERLNNEEKVKLMMKQYESDRRQALLNSYSKRKQFTNMLEMLSGQEGRPPPAPPITPNVSKRLEELAKPKEDFAFGSLRAHAQRSDFRGLFLPDHPAAVDTLLQATNDKMLLRTCPRTLVQQFADPLFKEHRWRIDHPSPAPPYDGVPGLKHREETWTATVLDAVPPAKTANSYQVHASDVAKPSVYLTSACKAAEHADPAVVALPEHLIEKGILNTIESSRTKDPFAVFDTLISKSPSQITPMDRSVRGQKVLPMQSSLVPAKAKGSRATSHRINDPHPPGNVILSQKKKADTQAEKNALKRAMEAGNLNKNTEDSHSQENYKHHEDSDDEADHDEKFKNGTSSCDISDKGLKLTAVEAHSRAKARMSEREQEKRILNEASSGVSLLTSQSNSNSGKKRGLMLESVLADIHAFEKNLLSAVVDSRFGNDFASPPNRKTIAAPTDGGYAQGVGKVLKQKSAESAVRRGVRDVSASILHHSNPTGNNNNETENSPSGAVTHCHSRKQSEGISFGVARQELEMSKLKDRPDTHDLISAFNVNPAEILAQVS
eukprot:GDKJ01022057.1.p1 GENE.GDKJ01022057.1~~GDKJ01022057.1.p1  ORF type:complete len:668 (-),score=117.20 GDKJ01022057.1:84-2087(-)